MTTFPVLSIAILCPILFGIVVLFIGKKITRKGVQIFSLIGSLLSFIVTLILPLHFQSHVGRMQFVEDILWIERFNIRYALGIDGISLWLVTLTAFMLVVVCLSSWFTEKENLHHYLGAFLILSGLMVGTFSALDGLLFYAFFEATLIPMFIIIGIWGGEKRIASAFKFFLYPFFGSLFMLVALLYLYWQTGTFDIYAWYNVPLALSVQIPLFVGFLLAFGIKLPMWPVHTWLPDAHVEAPTEGSVILAAIMLKLGGYGFIRFMLPIVPDACRDLSLWMIILSLISIIYIGLVAIVQKDMKKLVAYSSIVHMGFVTLGYFLMQDSSLEGAIVQMISHGLISAALFLCIGILYDQTHSRQFADYSGIVHKMPKFSVLFVLFAVANCALPGTSGFVGEVLVIMSAVRENFWLGLITASALILTAAYSLWMIKSLVFGPLKGPFIEKLSDVRKLDFVILGVIAFLVVLIGVYPSIIVDSMHASITETMTYVIQSKLP